MSKCAVVVLISGTGSNMAALLKASQDPQYPARIAGVISDRSSAGGLEIARAAGIPTAVVSLQDFPDRALWNAALAKTIGAFQPDLVVSAGFMKIIDTEVLAQFDGKIINCHPALLPAFPGAHGVRDALAYGAKVTGITIHVMDGGVDTGPIIAQEAEAVLPGDTEEVLHERLKVRERELLVKTVARIAVGGLKITGRVAELEQ